MDYKIPTEIKFEMDKKSQEHTDWMEGNITTTFDAFIEVFRHFYKEAIYHGMGHGFQMAVDHFEKMEKEK